ncbi:unnamed protein product [Lymnaea stagnalis]|uniref:Uncharacterized protein n=1 Tax=Lymnaea stagnalis TaxID=6523 RepID=A0AAV2HD01_LYMST
MADVANALNAVTPSITDSGNIVPPESPESVLLSPSVKEAVDRILPKSATQLLQQDLPFNGNPLLGSQSSKMVALGSTVPLIDSELLPCSLPIPPDTIALTTTSASGLLTSASRDTSSISFFSSVVSDGSPPINSSTKFIQGIKNNRSVSVNDDLTKKVDKIRISKADLEIISSSDILQTDARASKQHSSQEPSSNEDVDSEDMSRCFSGVLKEKKKRKKSKKKSKPSPDSNSPFLLKNNVNSNEELASINSSPRVDAINCDSDSDSSSMAFKGFLSTRNDKITKNNDISLTLETSTDSILGTEQRTHVTCSETAKSLPKEASNGVCAASGEDFSNISTSSSKENLIAQKRHSGQVIPVATRSHYHVIKHKNKIKNTFLPCFVVLSKLDSYGVNKIPFCQETILPLVLRVKHLSELCNKGSIMCKKNKRKGVIIVEEPLYKNIFEETILLGNSEDEFENVRGKRSLRKRDKHISYVEPSEDDILDDFSRKRSRSKIKTAENNPVAAELQESKKKKKTSESPEVSPKPTSENIINNTKEAVVYPNPATGGTVSEIIVYPRSKINNKPSSDLSSSSTSLPLNTGVEKKSRDKSSSRKKVSTLPPLSTSSHISVLPNASPHSLLQLPQTTCNQFSALSARLQGSLAPATSTGNTLVTGISGSPLRAILAPKPQYCVMKVDGKDVLLQLVPTNSVHQTLLLPGGKKLVMPNSVPSPQQQSNVLGHPHFPNSTLPMCTQTISLPITTMTSAAQPNIVSTAAFQNMIGIPIVSRGLDPSAPNISLSGLPVISASQLANFAASVRPLSFTSGGLMPQTSFPSLTTTATTVSLFTVSSTGTTSSIRLTSSTTPALSTLAPMAAPNSTTVVRSVPIRPGLHAVVPNQSASLRSIRIFVPGCTATGTPGRFATLGTVANSSPLTRLSASSDLLPQRKRSADQDLTAEQYAAKRRKLEKKYPLPPGVVIKTEPLDNPPPLPVNHTAARSLLPSNIQLVSSLSRTAGQTIRIISPSLASALSTRSIRGGNPGVIYKTASTGGRQTVLVPNSLGPMSAVNCPTPVTISSATTITTTSTSLATSSGTVITSLTTSSISGGMTNVPINSLVSVTAPSALGTVSKENPTPPIWSPALSLSTNTSSLTNPSESGLLNTALTSEISTASTPVVTGSSISPGLSSAQTLVMSSESNKQSTEVPTDAAILESTRTGLQTLKAFVEAQESIGLKGERLDKLKEILKKKEEHYKSLKDKVKISTLSSVSDATFTSNRADSGISTLRDGNILSNSETDPIVL